MVRHGPFGFHLPISTLTPTRRSGGIFGSSWVGPTRNGAVGRGAEVTPETHMTSLMHGVIRLFQAEPFLLIFVVVAIGMVVGKLSVKGIGLGAVVGIILTGLTV